MRMDVENAVHVCMTMYMYMKNLRWLVLRPLYTTGAVAFYLAEIHSLRETGARGRKACTPS